MNISDYKKAVLVRFEGVQETEWLFAQYIYNGKSLGACDSLKKAIHKLIL